MKCDEILSNLIKCDQMWSNLIKSDQIWSILINNLSNLIKSDEKIYEIWWKMYSNLMKSNQIWSNLMKSDQIWSNLIKKSDQIWSNLIKSDQIWSNLPSRHILGGFWRSKKATFFECLLHPWGVPRPYPRVLRFTHRRELCAWVALAARYTE